MSKEYNDKLSEIHRNISNEFDSLLLKVLIGSLGISGGIFFIIQEKIYFKILFIFYVVLLFLSLVLIFISYAFTFLSLKKGELYSQLEVTDTTQYQATKDYIIKNNKNIFWLRFGYSFLFLLGILCLLIFYTINFTQMSDRENNPAPLEKKSPPPIPIPPKPNQK